MDAKEQCTVKIGSAPHEEEFLSTPTIFLRFPFIGFKKENMASKRHHLGISVFLFMV